MGRPIGVKQKRNESKYWLPSGVSLKPNQTEDYNKSTKLIFIDHQYGEFISYFQAIQSANASVHPDAVKARREQTFITKYGQKTNLSPAGSQKFKQQMLEKYGVENPGQLENHFDKYKKTMLEKYGVDHPMKSQELVEKQKDTLFKNYGVTVPAKSEVIKQKMIETSYAKYGVDNYAKTDESKEKFLKTISEGGTRFKSKDEQELVDFIRELGLVSRSGYIGGANPKELDVIIDNLKIAIEYNGCLWHSEAYNRDHKYHLSKTEACENKGLKLIQIFDHEWKNRNQQVKSFLRSALGKNLIRIDARKCQIKNVNKIDAENFLNSYHILGSANVKYAYGLYFQDELVTLVTFSLHHRNNQELVLNRYVGKTDVTVRGGLSKLCRHAFKAHGQFTTWVDRRWSNGESWLKNGWELISTLKPDYFYFSKKTSKVVSKQSRQKKNVNTPVGMTEREHAIQDGLTRVWDCGKYKMIYKG